MMAEVLELQGLEPAETWPTHHDRVCIGQLAHLLERHPNRCDSVMGATGSGKTSVGTDDVGNDGR